MEKSGLAAEYLITVPVLRMPFIMLLKLFTAGNQFLPGKHGIPLIDPGKGPGKRVLDLSIEGDQQGGPAASGYGKQRYGQPGRVIDTVEQR
jgi:hypothetical protein